VVLVRFDRFAVRGLLALPEFAGGFGFRGVLGVHALFFLLPWGRELAKRNRPGSRGRLRDTPALRNPVLGRHGGFSASEGSVQQRLATYRATWEIVKDHPWFGIASANWESNIPFTNIALTSRPSIPASLQLIPSTFITSIYSSWRKAGWRDFPLSGYFNSFARTFTKGLSKSRRRPKDKELLIGTGREWWRF